MTPVIHPRRCGPNLLPPVPTFRYATFLPRHMHAGQRHPAVDEQQLISLCRDGNRDAQRRLYDQTADRVYRLIYGMTRSAEDASDLTQEVYLTVFRRLHQFRGDCSLATWVHRIAVNQVLALARRKRTEARHQRQLAEAAARATAGLRVVEDRSDVLSAMARLDPEDRVVLLLRYHQGLNYAEMADVLHCPGGTVASRLNRARERLRQLLAGPGAAGEEPERPVHLKIDGEPDGQAPSVEVQQSAIAPRARGARAGG